MDVSMKALEEESRRLKKLYLEEKPKAEIGQDCYLYIAKDDSQNELIAQWLVALTDSNRN